MISGHMQISDILSPAAVRTMSQITSKKRLFQEIAEQARSIYGVDAAQTLDALQERETLGPTGVGHGVALPHARLHGLDRVVGLFLRLEKPLDFDAVDRIGESGTLLGGRPLVKLGDPLLAVRR